MKVTLININNALKKEFPRHKLTMYKSFGWGYFYFLSDAELKSPDYVDDIENLYCYSIIQIPSIDFVLDHVRHYLPKEEKEGSKNED